MTNITKAAQDALAALDEIHTGKRHPQLALAVAQQLRAALQDKAVEVRIPSAGPSTYEQRFSEAIRLLTHASPPSDMVASWLDRTSEDLQHWIGSQKGAPEWAQCLAITDAAHAMAISPVEGEQHDFEPTAAQPAPVAPDGFALVPVVATFDMRAAGNIELDRLKNTPGMLVADRAFYVWSAMIAASQQKGGQ